MQHRPVSSTHLDVYKRPGIISLVYGVLRIISYFRNKSLSPFFAGELFLGIVLVAIGLFSFLNPGGIFAVLPIVLGILVLVEGISKLQRGLMLKNYGYQRWVAATVVAGCIIALGILLIFNPFNALVITMRVLGIVLAADGMAGLWVNFIIKRYYQSVSYTHLDVYKRQGYTRRRESRPAKRHWRCRGYRRRCFG